MTKDLWPPSHLYRVRRSSAPPGTSNGHIWSDAETTPACCCHRCPERPPQRKTKARSAPECVDGSSSDLKSALQRAVLQCWFEVRQHGARLSVRVSSVPASRDFTADARLARQLRRRLPAPQAKKIFASMRTTRFPSIFMRHEHAPASLKTGRHRRHAAHTHTRTARAPKYAGK